MHTQPLPTFDKAEDEWPLYDPSDASILSFEPGNSHELGKTKEYNNSYQELISLRDKTNDTTQNFVSQIETFKLPNSNNAGCFAAFLSRSALFSVSRVGHCDNEFGEISCQAPNSISATGNFRLLDKAILEVIIDAAKRDGIDSRHSVQTSLNAIAKAIGYSTNGKTLRAIEASLVQLCRVKVSVALSDKSKKSGSFIIGYEKSKTGITVLVDFDLIMFMLTRDLQFKLNVSRRAELKIDLSKWLHDFLSTHYIKPKKNAAGVTKGKEDEGAEPPKPMVPFSLGYLRKLSGFSAIKRNFPAALRKALSELVVNAPGLVASFDITRGSRDSDRWMVYITRGLEKPKFEVPDGLRQSNKTKDRALRRRGVWL